MTDLDDPKAYAERIAESVKEQAEGEGRSRRKFLNRSVLAGGALLALGSGTGFAVAQDGDSAADDLTADFDDVEGTDLDVLNYALTLEHLENAFYREGLEMFSKDDYAQAKYGHDFADLSTETKGEVRTLFDRLQVIGEHESAHVEVLSQAITLLGGEPNPEATYDFGLETVEGFLETARVLEKTGVGAYTGAAPFIQSPDLVRAAGSILSVEATHWSLLNDITGRSPIPTAFGPVLSQDEVLDAAGPFIKSG